MDRRNFVKLCTGTILAAGLTRSFESIAGQIEDFAPAKLVKEDGTPLKASEVGTEEAMVFAYPFNGSPCFLINVGDKAVHTQSRDSQEEGEYVNPTGAGPHGNLVAFVAICTHQLSYPTPEATFLRYAATGSELAGAPGRIVCCAHGSVFDPADGARKVSGPAPNPLVPVRLAYDPATDGLTATGTLGQAFFERFFKTYKSDLIRRYGAGVYRQEVGDSTKTIPLSRYSAVVPAC